MGINKSWKTASRLLLTRFSKEMSLFFIFSGHGVEENGINYLIPVSPVANLIADSVSLSFLLQKLNRAKPDLLSIIVLDCCRYEKNNSTYKAKVPLDLSKPVPLVRFPQESNFLIAFATD